MMAIAQVSVPSSSGLRPDSTSVSKRSARCVSVPSSSGLRPDPVAAPPPPPAGFSSFFFRTSAGLMVHRDQVRSTVSVPSSSGLRPDTGGRQRRRELDVSVPSSSGLRPDAVPRRLDSAWGFSSFFFRTSAGHRRHGRPREAAGFSSFFFRTSAGPLPSPPHQGFRVSVPSSSGLRPDVIRSRAATAAVFQFLLLQDFGRTIHARYSACSLVSVPSSSGLRPDKLDRAASHDTRFQFLLLQDFGRTNTSRVWRRASVSVPSSSGLRPD